MEDLIYQARRIAPNFDNITTQQQYELLKLLNNEITPEDLVYHQERQYYTVDICELSWENYLQTY